MKSSYPLFQSHIDLAHSLWQKLVKNGDVAVDATCGNGHDTLVLAKLVFPSSTARIYAMDKQADAILSCRSHLVKEIPSESFDQIRFIQGCHSHFPSEIASASVALIVYNLGYLPGGDKNQTTEAATTLLSVQEALSLLKPGGMISITCYPGHAEGKNEEETLLKFVATLDPRLFSCCYHRWINRNRSPGLLIIQKFVEANGDLKHFGSNG